MFLIDNNHTKNEERINDLSGTPQMSKYPKILQQTMVNKHQRIRKGQLDNPQKWATQGTKDEEKQIKKHDTMNTTIRKKTQIT